MQEVSGGGDTSGTWMRQYEEQYILFSLPTFQVHNILHSLKPSEELLDWFWLLYPDEDAEGKWRRKDFCSEEWVGGLDTEEEETAGAALTSVLAPTTKRRCTEKPPKEVGLFPPPPPPPPGDSLETETPMVEG